MKTTLIVLSKEESDSLTNMSVSAAQTLCEVLGIRFVIEDGKVKGLEI